MGLPWRRPALTLGSASRLRDGDRLLRPYRGREFLHCREPLVGLLGQGPRDCGGEELRRVAALGGGARHFFEDVLVEDCVDGIASVWQLAGDHAVADDTE